MCACVKNAFFVHFVKFCVFIFWNACFCSVKTFGGCARFSARFLSREQFGGNLVHFLCFSGSCFCLAHLFVFFVFVVVACFVLVCVLFFSVCCCWCCCGCCFRCCCCCCFLVVVVAVVVLIAPEHPPKITFKNPCFPWFFCPFSLPPSFSSFFFLLSFFLFLLWLPSQRSRRRRDNRKEGNEERQKRAKWLKNMICLALF